MLEGKTYCPVLHARVAEMKALQMLDSATKDLIFPLIVARPWPNAKFLKKTWEKITEAFGDRRFALDLDPFKYGTVNGEAGEEFDALFDGRGGFERYYNAVENLDFAVPVVQFEDQAIRELDRQIQHIEQIGRGAVLRIQRGRVADPIRSLDSMAAYVDDIVVWVDLGWTRDLLQLQVWASQIVEHVGRIRPETEVVFSGSSFPASFDQTERASIKAYERDIYDALVRANNAVNIRYGDWGSTRAPQHPKPMKIVKRIDLPVTRDWIYFKDGGAESYQDIAERVIADPSWPSNLHIWGTYVIEGTAEDVPGSIRGQAAAAAARVNIHLHQQAHYGGALDATVADEPFTDDF
ncbi:beta family protein [Brevundimonas aurantiaca]|uniref:beta family protein n=1 Tax=Brevundimonas aurantiaca TaxID=74316 RepID=UPI0030161178